MMSQALEEHRAAHRLQPLRVGLESAVAVGEDVGNLWRTTGDIVRQWDGKEKWGGLGVVQILDLNAPLYSYAGPGHWNDPDMLEVGNGGMNEPRYRSHFSLWCIWPRR